MEWQPAARRSCLSRVLCLGWQEQRIARAASGVGCLGWSRHRERESWWCASRGGVSELHPAARQSCLARLCVSRRWRRSRAVCLSCAGLGVVSRSCSRQSGEAVLLDCVCLEGGVRLGVVSRSCIRQHGGAVSRGCVCLGRVSRSYRRQQVGYAGVSTLKWYQALARRTGLPDSSRRLRSSFPFLLVIVIV